MSDLVRSLGVEHMLDRPDTVPFAKLRVGDTVRVHFRIVEGARERVQTFQGVVIAINPGTSDANFAVRRTGAHGVGVERIFPVHSPRLEQLEILRHAHVRRARLYYLRERTGKSARLREKRRFAAVARPASEAADAEA
ncbi:MAG: 50S ribosomal protein L19 [Ardenticatenales bacterium]